MKIEYFFVEPPLFGKLVWKTAIASNKYSAIIAKAFGIVTCLVFILQTLSYAHSKWHGQFIDLEALIT